MDERDYSDTTRQLLSPHKFARRFDRLRLQASIALFLEDLWPRLLPLLGVAAVFLILSWFGLWLGLSPVWRLIGLSMFALAALFALWPLRRLRWPDQADAIKRIEAASGTRHRPLSSFDDAPAAIAGDRDSGRALWLAHRNRQFAALKRLKVGWPKPDAGKVDPYQFRAALVLLLVVAFAYAGSDRNRRLVAMTDPAIEAIPALARIDAWVTPPDYTGRAPIFLTQRVTSNDSSLSQDSIIVPVGSVFTLQSDSANPLTVTSTDINGDVTFIEPGTTDHAGQSSQIADGVQKFEAKLTADANLTVAGAFGAERSWSVQILPDKPPTITLDGPPQIARSGALELRYLLEDDYGIVSGQAQFRPLTPQDETARPLYDAPEMALSLPRSRAKQGNGRTIANLTDHPWSGLTVQMVLSVIDDAEQEGRSGTVTLDLPIRPFRQPLARALVEQRQKLALDANQARQISIALDALLFAPERFIPDFGHYLAIDGARNRLLSARDDDDLRAVSDFLWEIAVAIEDGDLTDVERRLRDAQEALRDALENDASDEEISALTDALRDAMNEYLEALTREMQNNPPTDQAMPMDPNQEFMTQQDLNDMIDRMEDLARSGSRDAARDMLSQMQQMLENLQNGQPQMSQQQQQMQDMMRDMGELIDRQQQLMDETFRRDQQQQQAQRGDQQPEQQQGQQQSQQQQSQQQQSQQQGQQQGDQRGEQRQSQQQGEQNGQQQQGQQGQLSDSELEQALRELQQGQSDLHDGLQALMDQMEQNGMQPGGNMGEADTAMGQAESQLGQGQTGDALGAQSRALQALRDGAQDMMQQFAQQQGQGQQQGQQQSPGMDQGRQGQQQGRPGGMSQDRDPLGRPQRSRGLDDGRDVEVPDDIEIQRAREILDAIRRRLETIGRPDLELDYLERLLPR